MEKNEIYIDKNLFKVFEAIENAEEFDATFFTKYLPQVTADNFLTFLQEANIEVDENMLKIHESLKRGKRTISRAKPPSAEVQATVRPLRATAGRAALVSKIAEDAGITKSAAIKMLDSLVDSVTKTLKKGGAVTLLGFGTFSVTKRAARNGRNPQTGSVIKIKAKKVARFKPSPSLNEKMKR